MEIAQRFISPHKGQRDASSSAGSPIT